MTEQGINRDDLILCADSDKGAGNYQVFKAVYYDYQMDPPAWVGLPCNGVGIVQDSEGEYLDGMPWRPLATIQPLTDTATPATESPPFRKGDTVVDLLTDTVCVVDEATCNENGKWGYRLIQKSNGKLFGTGPGDDLAMVYEVKLEQTATESPEPERPTPKFAEGDSVEAQSYQHGGWFIDQITKRQWNEQLDTWQYTLWTSNPTMYCEKDLRKVGDQPEPRFQVGQTVIVNPNSAVERITEIMRIDLHPGVINGKTEYRYWYPGDVTLVWSFASNISPAPNPTPTLTYADGQPVMRDDVVWYQPEWMDKPELNQVLLIAPDDEFEENIYIVAILPYGKYGDAGAVSAKECTLIHRATEKPTASAYTPIEHEYIDDGMHVPAPFTVGQPVHTQAAPNTFYTVTSMAQVFGRWIYKLDDHDYMWLDEGFLIDATVREE